MRLRLQVHARLADGPEGALVRVRVRVRLGLGFG